jgi:hypothetical protein
LQALVHSGLTNGIRTGETKVARKGTMSRVIAEVESIIERALSDRMNHPSRRHHILLGGGTQADLLRQQFTPARDRHIEVIIIEEAKAGSPNHGTRAMSLTKSTMIGHKTRGVTA